MSYRAIAALVIVGVVFVLAFWRASTLDTARPGYKRIASFQLIDAAMAAQRLLLQAGIAAIIEDHAGRFRLNWSGVVLLFVPADDVHLAAKLLQHVSAQQEPDDKRLNDA